LSIFDTTDCNLTWLGQKVGITLKQIEHLMKIVVYICLIVMEVTKNNTAKIIIIIIITHEYKVVLSKVGHLAHVH